jgi:hypothetical protein
MDEQPDIWTGEGVRQGLARFYHEIAGVGLMFPRADCPIAVEFPGYPVVRLRPIEGLEFVEETIAAVGCSTELATRVIGSPPRDGDAQPICLPTNLRGSHNRAHGRCDRS